MAGLTKIEWEAIKRRHGNKCVLCGTPDKDGKLLEKAHLMAKSKGGSQYIPLCPNCHTKYDKGMLSSTQLKKLGLTPEMYKKVLPKKPGTTSKKSSQDLLGLKPLPKSIKPIRIKKSSDGKFKIEDLF
ncbi:hypothetical protein O0S10_03115 [Methanocorpusculum sp. MG]|uniref:HNH endonuclease n=1 Tax=Methanocorpusculum petauri TaxID=3002863 RepID=A0ABT4IF70_9EURY|nr:hypothetical protein [Methanocorpusculum petauri]MCZ0860221.1 hypothetical protein [Methanocorpusculum petauri]